jgi:hypothetical protein
MQTNPAERSGWLTAANLAKVLLWFVYVWLIVNLVLLLLAFTLRLLGANPAASFTDWVYRSVARTMAPFRGMFEPLALSDQSVLDTSLLFRGDHLFARSVVLAVCHRLGDEACHATSQGRRRQPGMNRLWHHPRSGRVGESVRRLRSWSRAHRHARQSRSARRHDGGRSPRGSSALDRRSRTRRPPDAMADRALACHCGVVSQTARRGQRWT